MAKPHFPPLLHLTYVLQQQADELLLRENGVGLSQVRIMSALGPSPISQRRIATSLQQTEANVSRQLQAMKKQGLVSVKRNKKDARQRDVCLSPKGMNTYDKAHKLLARQQAGLWKRLNRHEAEELQAAVGKLATNL